MRRHAIQLLASARQGNAAARLEVGRRYLLGVEGFPLNRSMGLDHLSHLSLSGSEPARVIVAEVLPLHEVVQLGQLPALGAAARSGSSIAQLKLGLWMALTAADRTQAETWLHRAQQAGHAAAPTALAALHAGAGAWRAGVLRALAREPGVEPRELVLLAMRHLNGDCGDAELLGQTLHCALAFRADCCTELADSVCTLLQAAERLPRFDVRAPSGRIEQLLEDCVHRGVAAAAYLLGRAHCGIDGHALRATALVATPSLRKGAALLLRAADAGIEAAWMHLYRVHSEHRSSVANPPLARFFLEKAALVGNVEAQRRLGALTLRTASTVHEAEQGIHWLYQAAGHGDASASRLLASLVLSVRGSATEAERVIAAVRADDPWTACRLRVSRDFGLTKLEGLSVDLVAGYRPWGLVVGPNAFVTQCRLSAPRAIPALTEQALDGLRKCRTLFGQFGDGTSPLEGDLRKRSARLRRLLQRHGGDDSLFFAEARSTTLQSLRSGPKWAFRARQPLRMALAAP